MAEAHAFALLRLCFNNLRAMWRPGGYPPTGAAHALPAGAWCAAHSGTPHQAAASAHHVDGASLVPGGKKCRTEHSPAADLDRYRLGTTRLCR